MLIGRRIVQPSNKPQARIVVFQSRKDYERADSQTHTQPDTGQKVRGAVQSLPRGVVLRDLPVGFEFAEKLPTLPILTIFLLRVVDQMITLPGF